MILGPVLRLMNFQLPWKFVVVPSYMAPCNILAIVLVGGVYLFVSTYVPNSTLQRLD